MLMRVVYENSTIFNAGCCMQDTKVSVLDSDNPYAASIKQWVDAPRFMMPNHLSRGAAEPSSLEDDLSSRMPEQDSHMIAQAWRKRNNYRIMERTIGIDGNPHRCVCLHINSQ